MKFQFTIASLLAITTLVAVVCGAFVIAPGLGIVLAIAAVPALVRTILTILDKRARNEPVPMGAKVTIFLLWLAVAGLALAGGVVVAYVVGFVVFISTCFSGTFFKATSLWTIPQIAGVAAAIALMAIFWRKIKF